MYANDLTLAASIDLFDALLTHDDGTLNLSYLRNVVEFRVYFVRLVARLAAIRRTDDEYERMRALAERRRASRDYSESDGEITLALIREIVSATHNEVCCFLFRALE